MIRIGNEAPIPARLGYVVMEKNVKFMTAIVFTIMVAACSFVTTTQEGPTPWTMPTVIRADTREFVTMRYEREIDIAYLWSLSQMALPNEVAFCLYGHAVDTTMVFTQLMSGDTVSLPRKVAIIDSVYVANIKSATPTYVEFEDGIACDPNPRLIGTAHTHPDVPHPQMGGNCQHSVLDVLYAQSRGAEYWFTLVLCTWTHSLMWADGRVSQYYVRNPSNPLSQDLTLPPDHPDVSLSGQYPRP